MPRRHRWIRIGHLAAIGAIRTALNYFLERKMKEERGELAPITANDPAG
jgi:uncharacterized membrane protein